jgi:hypothetical protein
MTSVAALWTILKIVPLLRRAPHVSFVYGAASERQPVQ